MLLTARAGIGVAFAFLTGLSLAIMNAVFPPERRAGAIAWYLAAVYAFGVIPATLGSLLAERVGWRSGLLVTPILAILVLVLTLRYVPETPSSARRTDIPGLLLVAVALIGLTYGVSQLQRGVGPGSTAPILAGLIAAVAFVWWELRCDDPALDMRIFRSTRFAAVVTAGSANNLVQGGSMTMVTFYLVIIRGESTWALALLLIPATLLSALAAIGAGRAAARFGNGATVVGGLVVLAVSVLLRLTFGMTTPILVVGLAIAVTTVGGAIVQTPDDGHDVQRANHSRRRGLGGQGRRGIDVLRSGCRAVLHARHPALHSGRRREAVGNRNQRRAGRRDPRRHRRRTARLGVGSGTHRVGDLRGVREHARCRAPAEPGDGGHTGGGGRLGPGAVPAADK